MTLYPPPARRSRRNSNSHSDRGHRVDFARQATINAFGWQFAKALDQADFCDRLPGDLSMPSPEARFK